MTNLNDLANNKTQTNIQKIISHSSFFHIIREDKSTGLTVFFIQTKLNKVVKGMIKTRQLPNKEITDKFFGELYKVMLEEEKVKIEDDY